MGRSPLWQAALAAAAVVLMGCASVVEMQAGAAPVATDKLETALRPGVSTTADVARELGEPYGKGGGFMPFHDSAHLVWTYFRDEGSVDIGKGEMNFDRTYLFVFFAGDVFDSYMYFTSKLRGAGK